MKPEIEDDRTNRQLDLIKLIKDRGLDPANIFAGITIGFDPKALLDQTSIVVEAMVKQIKRNNQ